MNAPPERSAFRRQTPEERALQIGWSAALSESNRRVKLASRPDAEARLAAAEAKRITRRAKRRIDTLAEEFRT